MSSNFLGNLEESVMLAVRELNNNAYGTTIHEALAEANRQISIGSLYVSLSRLEDKGYLKSKSGEPTKERGGKAKRYFSLTGAGCKVLQDTAKSRDYLSKGVYRQSGGLAWNS